MEVLHYNLDMTPESEWKIVSAGAFARDKLLYLQEAGHFFSGANYYTVRKELDSYLVKLTLSGAGILEYGGETYRLPAGSFFWIDCRAPQHYYTAPDAGQWDVLWFHFYGATADAYYQAFLSQTQGRAAASLPVDSPVSALMCALLALAGEDGGGLGRDLDASALMTTILCGLIYGAALGIMTYVFRVFSPYECAACCALLIVSSIPEWLDLISHRTERIRFMREEEQRLANSTKPE